jgi:hypothetical protein
MPQKSALSGRSERVERKLDEYGVKWTYREKVSVSEFDVAAGLRNQARMGKPLRDDVVTRYREGMKAGQKFPAVVAGRKKAGDRLLVNADGNHRTVVARELGKTLDVYELDPETPTTTLMRLTYALNADHGLPTSDEDRIQQALHLIEIGLSARDAAHELVLPVARVEAERRKADANARVVEMGVNIRDWEALQAPKRIALSSITTDEGLAGAIKLTRQADLGMDDLKALVSDMNKSRSVAKQNEVLRAHREIHQDTIANGGMAMRQTVGKRESSPRSILARSMGILRTMPAPELVAARYTETERPDAVKAVDETIAILQAVRNALLG